MCLDKILTMAIYYCITLESDKNEVKFVKNVAFYNYSFIFSFSSKMHYLRSSIVHTLYIFRTLSLKDCSWMYRKLVCRILCYTNQNDALISKSILAEIKSDGCCLAGL